MKTIKLRDLWSYDEASIRTETQAKKCVTRRGEPVILPIEKNYQNRWNILAAINGLGEVVYQILQGGQTKSEVIKFLKKVRRFCKYRSTVITMDNFNTHRNHEVYGYAKQSKMFLHFQPTHSPFLNGVEELWRQLRRWLAHRLFRTRAVLHTEIEKFFKSNKVVNISITRYLC